MKKKLLFSTAIVAMLLICFFSSFIKADSNVREHQHLTSNKKEESLHTDEVFCTHLPIVTIDTQGQKIPGLEREKDLVRSNLKIFYSEQSNNYLTDKPQLSLLADIKYRGNTSLHFDKKSYLLKFVNEDGSERQEEVMGMPSHDNWILNGPFLDKSLLRNYMGMNISAEIMGYAPRVRFCEVYVNEIYQGVYVMMEMISQGKDRVDISAYKEGDPFTSYILRSDRGDVEENELNNFTRYAKWMPNDTERIRYRLNIEYPSKRSLTPQLKEYIERDFSKFEKSIYSYDYDDKVYGYKNYIDTQSFVDYFIINEFFQNYDAGIYSTYFHKDVSGKINIGPVWDFNNAFNNYIDDVNDGTGFVLQGRTWYYMLTKDKNFIESVISRYKNLRRTILNEDYLMKYIDDTVNYLGPAINRNYEVWGYSFDPAKLTEGNKLVPSERNITSYEEGVNQLKDFIKVRGSWMDKNIETLYQYCHQSKVKKFNH